MNSLLIIIAIIVALVLMRICYTNGVTDGDRKARAGIKKYLDARVDGAMRGVTPLSVNDYVEHCMSTVASKIYNDRVRWFDHITKKLAGETGEFMEHVGKASRDDDWDLREGVEAMTPERRMSLLKELGDILWYVVVIAAHLGSSLGEIMLLNIKKREGRRQRGTLKGDGDER